MAERALVIDVQIVQMVRVDNRWTDLVNKGEHPQVDQSKQSYRDDADRQNAPGEAKQQRDRSKRQVPGVLW